MIRCILIKYPASEEHDWDGVVTRMSGAAHFRMA
jgi:hypothetical protein